MSANEDIRRSATGFSDIGGCSQQVRCRHGKQVVQERVNSPGLDCGEPLIPKKDLSLACWHLTGVLGGKL